ENGHIDRLWLHACHDHSPCEPRRPATVAVPRRDSRDLHVMSRRRPASNSWGRARCSHLSLREPPSENRDKLPCRPTPPTLERSDQQTRPVPPAAIGVLNPKRLWSNKLSGSETIAAALA